MRKSDLQFISDTLVMQRLFHEPSLHKTAQDGMGSVLSKVEEIVGVKDHSVESILAFIGPGLLWKLGFPWMAGLFAIAEAFGFDWAKFFTDIKNKLKPFLEELTSKKSEDTNSSDDTDRIAAIVQEAAEAAMSDTLDPDKVQEAVETFGSINNMLYMKQLCKQAGPSSSEWRKIMRMFSGTAGSVGGSRVRRGLLGFIVKLFSWVLTAVLISCGFAVVGGWVSGILGVKKDKASGTTTPAATKEEPENKDIKLYLNPSASAELSTTTYNDDNHVWLMHKNINEIHDAMVDWAQELYPQLTDKSAISSNEKFNATLHRFQDRNKNAQIALIAVPTPFRSIKDIVDSFAYNVALHMPAQAKPSVNI